MWICLDLKNHWNDFIFIIYPHKVMDSEILSIYRVRWHLWERKHKHEQKCMQNRHMNVYIDRKHRLQHISFGLIVLLICVFLQHINIHCFLVKLYFTSANAAHILTIFDFSIDICAHLYSHCIVFVVFQTQWLGDMMQNRYKPKLNYILIFNLQTMAMTKRSISNNTENYIRDVQSHEQQQMHHYVTCVHTGCLQVYYCTCVIARSSIHNHCSYVYKTEENRSWHNNIIHLILSLLQCLTTIPMYV